MNAIEKKDGPCVVFAGAGTGKTHTIVEKLKYLITNNTYDSSRIVCITFSNEAANNLLSRVQKSLNLEAGKEPVIRTFHGFSGDLLKKYGSKIGISEDFGILTPDEAKVVIHRNFKINPYNCHRYISSISTAKDLGITIEQLKLYLQTKMVEYKDISLDEKIEELNFELQTIHLNKKDNHKKELQILVDKLTKLSELKKFIGAWEGYEKIKHIKNYQDYSDLNSNALKLLNIFPEASNDYDYIFVDEFQDTNKVQVDFLISLSKNRNITVVGDMNQSIYRFRGAYKDNFNYFKKSFGVAEKDIFTLDLSRRSPDKVLRAAHKLILNNYSNKEECFEVKNFENREGDKIKIFELKNGREEARKVSEIIQEKIKSGLPPEKICVMFRTHQQGRVIRQALEREKLPFTSVTKNSLFSQKSVKKVISFLTIMQKLSKHEKGGESAWWDLIYNSGFIEQDLILIGKFMKDNKESEFISGLLKNKLTDIELSQLGKILARILIERIELLVPLSTKNIAEMLPEVYRLCGVIQDSRSREGKQVMMNLDKFLELAKTHSGLYGVELDGFLYYLEILKNLEIDVEAPEIESAGVRLMTLHATKGLEYPVVILTNLAQKRFPLERYGNKGVIPLELYPEFNHLHQGDISEADMEYAIKEHEKEHQIFDERRLCYVAFTRAQEELILTYSTDYAGRKFFPSQFLQEINYQNNPDLELKKELEEKVVAVELNNFIPASQLEIADSGVVIDLPERPVMLVKPDLNKLYFSPSALLLFEECQKQYEYKYIYNMPERKTFSWEAMKLGSFIHEVLEIGVKQKFQSVKDFIDLAREMQMKEDWNSVELSDAVHMIKVFFERNKLKYNENSKTEQMLNAKLGKYRFTGYADRIDFHKDGIEIIDYKTGKTAISPKHREWQLGYYALAAKNLGIGNAKRITLDMLKLEKPVEFEVMEDGEAVSTNSDARFNIYSVQEDLLSMAENIVNAYEKGFKPCPIEKNCEFCNEYVYGN
jgi:DNA helicase II / ATP-dependent DNA helicase PcrA